MSIARQFTFPPVTLSVFHSRSVNILERRALGFNLSGGGMSTPQQLTSLRVVLVDDSPRFLSMLERALGSDPRVTVVGQAHSGQEALTQVSRLQPDLVILDLAMPGMNGIEATRRMKAHEGAPRVIMLTLYDTPQHRTAALEAGVDHFICKAELRTQLWSLLNSLLDTQG